MVMRKGMKFARHLAYSLLDAIALYQYHNNGERPRKAFVELDAFFVLMALDDGIRFTCDGCTFHGVEIERVDVPGLGIYLCGDPVALRQYENDEGGLLFVRWIRKFLDLINRAMYRNGTDHLFCTRCFRRVTISGSYSCRGHNATCWRCVEKGMENEGMLFSSEYCIKYIWVDD